MTDGKKDDDIGLFETQVRRTDNAYRGKPDSEKLIGTDLPQEVQEWEAMDEEEREEALRQGRTPPQGAQI